MASEPNIKDVIQQLLDTISRFQVDANENLSKDEIAANEVQINLMKIAIDRLESRLVFFSLECKINKKEEVRLKWFGD